LIDRHSKISSETFPAFLLFFKKIILETIIDAYQFIERYIAVSSMLHRVRYDSAKMHGAAYGEAWQMRPVPLTTHSTVYACRIVKGTGAIVS